MEKLFVPFREREQLAGSTWPNGARLAVAMYIAIEEWDEESMVKYGNPPKVAPPLLKDMERPDLAIMSTFEYGYRVGIWRLLEIFEDFGVKPTLLSNGLAMERHPELFQELDSLGYRIVSHSYDQCKRVAQLSSEELREDIHRCVQIARDVTGQRPLGWGSPGTRQYEEIFDMLLDEGFEFHQGLHDDELPYFLQTDSGRHILEIPYRIVDTGELNDFNMSLSGEVRIPSECFSYVREFFDARYEEAAKRPAFVSFGCHPYISGRPDRAKVVRYFLQYIRGFNDIWLAGNFDEVYLWWKKQFGPRFGIK
jgi:allantoinase